ncbi:hypothetical protein Aab01nite_48540 [Paractinoplanes abujensis]|uniref:Aminoglycoside phosphotransferase n=1 Tax=Paractinoplanes abujensis TaxID=882441 RepID=A0A7W7CNW1_9ACTN|nr:hypothetical protein [Actinoplanes abujensis]MBB4690498.1 hypothetical protein [Actinoplanes abujensis]GID21264.1 hypothetical protein Aab01nite_48540 [Actinoplanes abujensis]
MGDLRWQELQRVQDRRLARHAGLIPVRAGGERCLVKRYDRPVNEASLRAMVSWRDKLPERDRQHLDDISAWPRHLVLDGDTMVGPLIPLAGDEFFDGGAAANAVRHEHGT